MKIVTTPMCEELVKLVGIKNYKVNKHPNKDDGDLAILLSESKVEIDFIPLKVNSAVQIFESIKKIDFNNNLTDEEIISFFDNYPLAKKYLNNNESGLDIRLEIDGGVKVDNIAEIASAGADMFVAGSAIFGKPDYKQIIDQMRTQLASVK